MLPALTSETEGHSLANILLDGGFHYPTPPQKAWTISGGMAQQWTNGMVEFHRVPGLPLGEPQHIWQASTQLHYFGARYYRNVWGRFTSVDPGQASGSPQDPQGWNAYAYARNNPLRFIDPDGLTYVVRGAYGGIATVDDDDWQSILRSPGPGHRVFGGSVRRAGAGESTGAPPQSSGRPTYNPGSRFEVRVRRREPEP